MIIHPVPCAFVLLLLAALPAAAGVVVTERETAPDGAGGTTTTTRTTYLEGKRHKVVSDTSIVITDLDKGKTIWLDPKQKIGQEMPVGGGASGAAAAMGKDVAAGMTYKPTGKRRTVAGQSCEEHVTTMKVMGSESTILTCFSKDAPGAAEYAAYGRAMATASGMKVSAKDYPEGMTLATETTTKMGAPPGMPPEFARMMAEQMAKQGPQVTRTEVISIKLEALPASTFALPAGYTLQKAPGS